MNGLYSKISGLKSVSQYCLWSVGTDLHVICESEFVSIVRHDRSENSTLTEDGIRLDFFEWKHLVAIFNLFLETRCAKFSSSFMLSENCHMTMLINNCNENAIIIQRIGTSSFVRIPSMLWMSFVKLWPEINKQIREGKAANYTRSLGGDLCVVCESRYIRIRSENGEDEATVGSLEWNHLASSTMKMFAGNPLTYHLRDQIANYQEEVSRNQILLFTEHDYEREVVELRDQLKTTRSALAKAEAELSLVIEQVT